MPKVFIKQQTLQDLVNARQILDDLRKAVKVAEEEAGKLEAVVMHWMKEGCDLEKGPLTAEVGKSLRVVVAWKEVCAEKLGAEFVEKVQAETAPRVMEKLVVKVAVG